MWGMETLFKDQSRISTMVNVRLPIKSKEMADKLMKVMFEKNHTYFNVYDLSKYNQGESIWYVRISCCIYNQISDFIEVGNQVLKIIESG